MNTYFETQEMHFECTELQLQDNHGFIGQEEQKA